MEDQTTLDHIIELKQKLLSEKVPGLQKRKYDPGLYAEGVEVQTPFNSAYTESMSNRGNKLYTNGSLKLSSLRSYPSNFSSFVNEEENAVAVANSSWYASKKRRIINSSNGDVENDHQKNGEGQNDEEVESDEDEDEDINPWASINLAEILAPIQHPSDIITRKNIARNFTPGKKGNHLLKLAYDTIEVIEAEQKNVIMLTRLMNMFLGDEHHELTPENINLPDYDHKLSLKDLNRSVISDPNELFKDVQSGDEDDTKDEEDNRKIVTRSKDNARITDPFFQLPNFTQNKFISTIDPAELEEARQLTQITLQRNQEFIRCLTKIRNGCVKVDKFKQNIHKWAKEMHGDFGEEDAVAPDPVNNSSQNGKGSRESSTFD